MKKYIDTLVISGGGIKGIAFIGVFKYLEEFQLNTHKSNDKNIIENVIEKDGDIDNNKINIDIKKIYAISVGSIIGFLYAIGYKSEEMEREIMFVELQKLQKMSFKTFIKNYGLDSGNMIMSWLERLVENKGYNKTMTFKQLYKQRGIELNIGSTNLNKYKDVFFNYKTTPNLRVIRAIRMSIGIPLIFSAIKYKGEIYIDGGIINNFPIKMFEDELTNNNILGLKITTTGEMEENIDRSIESIDTFLYHIVNCFILQKEKTSTLSYKYAEHTIFVNTNLSTINFNLNNDEKKSLIDLGYCSARGYFEEYKR